MSPDTTAVALEGTTPAVEDTGVISNSRKSRGPKQRPPFYILPTQETGLKELRVENGFWYEESYNNDINNTQYLISPYTNYIPIHYLLYKNTKERFQVSHYFQEILSGDLRGCIPNYAKFPAEARAKLISKLQKEMQYERRFLGEFIFEGSNMFVNKHHHLETKSLIESWLAEDRPLNIPQLYQNPKAYDYTSRYSNVALPFVGDGVNSAIIGNMRSYKSLSALLALYKMDDMYFGRNWIPCILAVVLPEDYIYHKLHILSTNKIDLSKVIVFVDRELDNTQYLTPAFRKMYKQKCEPFLETLGCQIYKVPAKFMTENCFLPDFKLLKSSSLGRMREKEDLIKEFYKEFSKIEPNPPEEPEEISEEGLIPPPEELSVDSANHGYTIHYQSYSGNVTSHIYSYNADNVFLGAAVGGVDPASNISTSSH